ncbi:MAG: quinoprotein dehydrogenase-associated SoxYZ-like carrier [Burkholderiales bacterium]|nr:quinoprotein dehydrogenase-associated SoxYZ-like carrier [Burkholderiales bacterium]
MNPLFKGLLAGLLVLLPFGVAVANEKAEPDPAKSQYWPPIRQMMFGEREILDGKDVVRVYLSTRADDASTVPVAVKAQIDQTPGQYIKQVYLIVERNPSPAAGIFQFTPDSGRAQVETRLRFEDFSFVRAVAETNDGKLYMASRWVKAAGGCSAPGDKNRLPANLVGTMKFRFADDTVEAHKPALVQLMIRHPNESALASDFDESKTPQFVRQVKVTYAGKTVMSADVDFSISDNPSFRFYFVPEKEGELQAIVEDTHDKRYVHKEIIVEGVPLPGG